MRRRCCAVRVLSELNAFKEELNKVEKLFKKAGHLCVFLPKYHPELNAIERYWGHIKYLLRLHCEYSLPHMLDILPDTMRNVPVEFTRAWSRVTWLYIAAYDDGLVDTLRAATSHSGRSTEKPPSGGTRSWRQGGAQDYRGKEGGRGQGVGSRARMPNLLHEQGEGSVQRVEEEARHRTGEGGGGDGEGGIERCVVLCVCVVLVLVQK